MNVVVDALLFFLPAGIANMAPPIANKIPWVNRWDAPMDFSRTFRDIRIFGDHKTWRGFISAVICGTLTGVVLYYTHFHNKSELSYLLLCTLMSAGALTGDAVKSFFKRRVKVKPGSSWFPFDQIDFIVGGLLFALPFGVPPLPIILATFGLFFGGTIVATYIGYLLGIREAPI